MVAAIDDKPTTMLSSFSNFNPLAPRAYYCFGDLKYSPQSMFEVVGVAEQTIIKLARTS